MAFKIVYRSKSDPENPGGPKYWWVWVATAAGGIIATLSRVPWPQVVAWLESNGFMTR